MRSKNWILYIAGGIIVVGIVIILAIFFNEKFSFPESIQIEANPFDLLSMSMTALIAIYITLVLSKKNEDHRKIKDKLIDEIEYFNSSFSKNINEKLELNKEIPDTELPALFKIERRRSYSLIEKCKSGQFIPQGNEIETFINKKITEIKDDLTDVPAKFNKITLTEELKQKTRIDLIELDEMFFQLILLINDN